MLATIENCYAAGTVTSDGDALAGGITGRNYNSTIKNSVALQSGVSSASGSTGRIMEQTLPVQLSAATHIPV